MQTIQNTPASKRRQIQWPANKIVVGHYNPRTTMDPVKLAELSESIKAVGILQRPLLRPIPFEGEEIKELVYGQRRFAAAVMAFGEDAVLEFDEEDLTDEQAVLAASTENDQREPNGPAEEAEAAARVLAVAKGDRAEAARLIGWKLEKLVERLKLMACSPAVRKQITERKISLGVAELLAALPTVEQDQYLEAFAANGAPQIEDFRSELQAKAKNLARAIFDKAECLQCPHNSGVQRSMFATGLDEGHCLKGECYDAKTEGALQTKAANLKDEWPTVRIVYPADRLAVRMISAEGSKGAVGVEQASKCKLCPSYGAAVSAATDTLGRVVGGLCFDNACNDEKQAIYQAELAALKAKQTGQQEDANIAKARESIVKAAKAAKTRSSAPKPAKTGKGDAGKGEQAEEAAAITTVSVTGPVRDYREKLFRTVLMRELASSQARCEAMLLALAAASRLTAIPSTPIQAQLKANADADGSLFHLADLFTTALGLDDKRRAAGACKMAAFAAEKLTVQEMVGLLKTMELDWSKHFKLDAGFLSVVSKAEIIGVAQSLGITDKLKETHKTLTALKKDELIAKVLGVEGFEYQGAIPDVLKPDYSSD